VFDAGYQIATAKHIVKANLANAGIQTVDAAGATEFPACVGDSKPEA